MIHGMADSMECFPWGRIVLQEPVGLVQFMSPLKLLSSMKPLLFPIGSGLSWKQIWTSFLYGFAFCLLLLLMCQVFVISTCLCLSKTITPCSVLSFSFLLLTPFLPSLLPFFLFFLACFLVKVVTKVYLETSCLLFVLDRNVSSTLQTKRLRTGLIW